MTSSSLLAALIAFPAFGFNLHSYEAVEPHMGTLFRIKLYAEDEAQAKGAFRAAFARIAELDDILTDYKPDSELNRLPRDAVRHAVRVSDDLFRVLNESQQVSEKTSGAFDITIGPLTHLWREARKKHRIPEATDIEEARARCGYSKLHLDYAEQTVELDEAGMQLDAGGIAKGDAADQALLILSQYGIRSALVAASGDLAFSNAPPGEAGWKIGLDSLDNARAPFTRILLLADGAVSTSGPEEQHLAINGVRYSHIIDPNTGLGLTRDITASVIARTGIEADCMATALSVLGEARGLAFIEQEPGLAALVVTNDGEHTHVNESKNFRNLRTAR